MYLLSPFNPDAIGLRKSKHLQATSWYQFLWYLIRREYQQSNVDNYCHLDNNYNIMIYVCSRDQKHILLENFCNLARGSWKNVDLPKVDHQHSSWEMRDIVENSNNFNLYIDSNLQYHNKILVIWNFSESIKKMIDLYTLQLKIMSVQIYTILQQ